MEDKTKITQKHVHFQYESKDGDLSGHCTGHGFTIVWNDRPPREYVTGPEVKDILDVCQERLDYLDEYASPGEKKAYALITQAIDILQAEQDISIPSVVRATPQDAIMHNAGLLANYINDGDIDRAEAVVELLRIQIKTILGHPIETDIWKKLSDLERENIAVYFEIKD